MDYSLIKALSLDPNMRGRLGEEYQPRALQPLAVGEADPFYERDEVHQVEPIPTGDRFPVDIPIGDGPSQFSTLMIGVRCLTDLPKVLWRLELSGTPLNQLHGLMGMIAVRPDALSYDGEWYMVDLMMLWPEGVGVNYGTRIGLGASSRVDMRLRTSALHRADRPDSSMVLAAVRQQNTRVQNGGEHLLQNFKWLVDHIVVHADDFSELDEITLTVEGHQLARVRAADFRVDPFRCLGPSPEQVREVLEQVHEISKIMPVELGGAVLPFVLPRRPEWEPHMYLLPFSRPDELSGSWKWEVFPEAGVNISRAREIYLKTTWKGDESKVISAFTLARNILLTGDNYQIFRFST